MSLNHRKIITILLEECAKIDDRCDGYQEELIEVISEILEYERGHRVSATNIQKKINDKCNATAHFLVTQRGQDLETQELAS